MKQKVIKYTILLLLIPVIISIVLSFMQVDEEKKYPILSIMLSPDKPIGTNFGTSKLMK